MTWIKLDDAYPEHRKLKRAGDLRALCMALDVAGMCFCGRFNTDGFIGDDDLPGVLEVLPSNRRGMVLAKLCQIGRWDRDEERRGYWVRDYLKYNPSASRREEIAEAGRKRAQASRDRSRERTANDHRTFSEAPPNVRGASVGGSAPPSPSPLSTDVVPFLTVEEADEQPNNQSEREGKTRTTSRRPKVARHPSDPFVTRRVQEIRREQGNAAAMAYLRTVGINFGTEDKADQLRRLEAWAAQHGEAIP